MIDPTVRPATPEDVGEVERLESLARRDLAGQRGGERWLATHPAHRGRVPEGASLWVATIDAVVVGYLLSDLDGGTAHVRDVYVHPGARELGFGDELLAAAVTAARAAGAARLEAEALPGDRDIKNLYERAGIKARLIVVSTEL